MSTFELISAPTDQTDPADGPDGAGDETELLTASAARAERRLRVLAELTEIGMDLTRSLHRQALAAEAALGAPAAESGNAETAKIAPHTPQDVAAVFAKLSRAVRLTVDLEGRADEALRALRAGEVAAVVARRQARENRVVRAADQRREDARDHIADQIGIAIRAEVETESETFELTAALNERLADDRAYDDCDEHPLREVVEQLCEDLGLSPDWSGWTDSGWPEPPVERRPPWSPFNQVSRRPILQRNRQGPCEFAQQMWEVADRSP